MSKIITEITPLSEKDCFYLIDRRKTEFDYPIHRHDELELNFVANCAGARRVVGDSMEVLGSYDLVLVGGGLEHAWEQHSCPRQEMREITVQFSPSLFTEELMQKNQMGTLRDLLTRAAKGIAFDMAVILRVYGMLDELTRSQPGFLRWLKLLEILYHLSTAPECHTLASSSFANAELSHNSRRIRKVEEAINRDYAGQIYLKDIAELAGMTPTAFSRFFKTRTGTTLSEYITNIRIGHAARKLVDTTMTIAEICYECGFNNISNFNRLFKKKKGCSPKTFRENYLKTKLII